MMRQVRFRALTDECSDSGKPLILGRTLWFWVFVVVGLTVQMAAAGYISCALSAFPEDPHSDFGFHISAVSALALFLIFFDCKPRLRIHSTRGYLTVLGISLYAGLIYGVAYMQAAQRLMGSYP